MEEELCAAYGTCADSWQFSTIVVDEGQARIDYQACMGCGVCVSKCPQEALSLVRDPARGEPLEIQKLIERVGQAAPVRGALHEGPSNPIRFPLPARPLSSLFDIGASPSYNERG